MDWIIIYTVDYDVTRKQQIINAGSYTQAYIQFVLNYAGIILEIKKF